MNCAHARSAFNIDDLLAVTLTHIVDDVRTTGLDLLI